MTGPVRLCRNAFTVIELLVVLSLFGVMIALLLPVIAASRAAVKRASCQNNLKQVALALHTYHHDFQGLPPGYVTTLDREGQELGPGWGWCSLALTQIERGNNYNAINFGSPVAHPDNRTVLSIRMKTFLCPADEDNLTGLAVESTFAKTRLNVSPAETSYVGSFGTGDPEAVAGRDAGEGAFFRNSRISFEMMTDGTSSTFLVGERTRAVGFSSWTGVIAGTTVSGELKRPEVLGPSLILGSTAGGGGPNGRPIRRIQFASRHEAGAYFAFGDGSVRFVSDGIGRPIYSAFATRAGGELIPAGDD